MSQEQFWYGRMCFAMLWQRLQRTATKTFGAMFMSFSLVLPSGLQELHRGGVGHRVQVTSLPLESTSLEFQTRP